MKKTTKKATKQTSSRTPKTEFRPYRVLFLVVAISVTTIVLLAYLGVSSDL